MEKTIIAEIELTDEHFEMKEVIVSTFLSIGPSMTLETVLTTLCNICINLDPEYKHCRDDIGKMKQKEFQELYIRMLHNFYQLAAALTAKTIEVNLPKETTEEAGKIKLTKTMVDIGAIKPGNS